MVREKKASRSAPGSVTDSLHRWLSDQEARDLIRRAQQFDDGGLTRLYHLFADRIFRFIYYRLQDRARAEELTSDVFLRLLERVQDFRISGDDVALALNGWIFTIARNVVIDEFRKSKNQPTAQSLSDEWQDTVDDASDLEIHLTRADLQRALAALTEEQQTVLNLRFEEGWTTAQIARMMGKTEMAIKALQRRGLASMARLLSGPTKAAARDAGE